MLPRFSVIFYFVFIVLATIHTTTDVTHSCISIFECIYSDWRNITFPCVSIMSLLSGSIFFVFFFLFFQLFRTIKFLRLFFGKATANNVLPHWLFKFQIDINKLFLFRTCDRCSGCKCRLKRIMDSYLCSLVAFIQQNQLFVLIYKFVSSKTYF